MASLPRLFIIHAHDSKVTNRDLFPLVFYLHFWQGIFHTLRCFWLVLAFWEQMELRSKAQWYLRSPKLLMTWSCPIVTKQEHPSPDWKTAAHPWPRDHISLTTCHSFYNSSQVLNLTTKKSCSWYRASSPLCLATRFHEHLTLQCLLLLRRSLAVSGGRSPSSGGGTSSPACHPQQQAALHSTKPRGQLQDTEAELAWQLSQGLAPQSTALVPPTLGRESTGDQSCRFADVWADFLRRRS